MYDSKTATARDLQSSRTMSYGDGASSGLLSEDQSLGDVPEEDIRDENRSKKANGLLGLGFPKNTLDLVGTLKVQKRVKHASLSLNGARNDPKIAVKINERENHATGWLLCH